jgi:hypothetical protein
MKGIFKELCLATALVASVILEMTYVVGLKPEFWWWIIAVGFLASPFFTPTSDRTQTRPDLARPPSVSSSPKSDTPALP